jgi:tetratricopeptide (TPR) repeat protein
VLRLTTTDAVQVWCNDALLASEEKLGDGEPDNLRVAVTLHAGWNKLLVKTLTRRGEWTLGARLTDERGTALSDVRYASTPQTYSKAPAGKLTVLPFAPLALDTLTSGNRKDFLASRFAQMAGRRLEVLAPLERLRQALPNAPLSRYFTAFAYWANDELGKAIDLLSAGAKENTELPAFLVARGRYYKQKKQWDKSLADLRQALGTKADAELARRKNLAVGLELADVYKTRGFTLDRCRAVESLTRDWPDYAWALGELGDCQDDRGYTQRAEETYRAALALTPGSRWLLQRLANLAQRRLDYAEALSLTTAMMAIQPSANLLVQRSTLLRRPPRPCPARARTHRPAPCPVGR